MKTRKRCPKCKKTRALKEFHRNSRNPDGVQDYCKKCMVERVRSSQLKYHRRYKASRRVAATPRHVLPGTKWCHRCKTAKMLTDFPKNRTTSDGLATYCKPCSSQLSADWQKKNPQKVAARWKRQYADPTQRTRKRHRNRAAQYGLTLKQLSRLLEQADGKCRICQRETELHVDHCHASGVVRGMLCRGCNMGLGFFKDDPETMKRAVDYLLSFIATNT